MRYRFEKGVKIVCKYCGKEKVIRSSRGICQKCERIPRIKEHYPKKTNEELLVDSLEHGKVISKSEIVIKVWRENPFKFGLDHFEEEYPDANKIYTLLYGTRGIIKKGILLSIEENIFYVNKKDKECPFYGENISILKSKIKEVKESLPEKINMTELTKKNAYEKWVNGKKELITLTDAIYFWNVENYYYANDEKLLREKLIEITDTLEDLPNYFEEKNNTILHIVENHFSSNGLQRYCISTISHLSQWMKEKWKRVLGIEKHRKLNASREKKYSYFSE